MPETQSRPAPTWRGDGIPEFPQKVHWLTFDACKGVLLCGSMGTEVSELLCVVMYAHAVRVLTVPGGQPICASDNRETSCFGRRGQRCASCEDRDGPCRIRWRIWMREVESEAILAHTLSITASVNFAKYADELQQSGHLPSEVITNVFVEDFTRKRSGLSFRRLQFECASHAAK
ncbi:MAG TPA: hypothetical protein VGK19_04470 [Capsulimonadaceae bacterium]